MTDIVERLGKVAFCNLKDGWASQTLASDAATEITRLRQLLSEVEKREKEARAKAIEEAAKVAWIEGWKSPDEISAAIRALALQSEER